MIVHRQKRLVREAFGDEEKSKVCCALVLPLPTKVWTVSQRVEAAVEFLKTKIGQDLNSRKLSPVFTGGPQMEEVPALWVDRAGAKATVTQNFSRQSKATASVVLEEVTARDESGAVVGAGAKPGAGGQLSADGPPTTHSGTGTDRIMFAQGGITRDTTRFVNGTPVGARDIFNLDQSVGLGSGFPVYNRFAAECTRFFQLLPESQKTNRPPPVAVVGRPGRRAHERGLGAVRVSVLRAATLSPSQSSAGKSAGGEGRGGGAQRGAAVGAVADGRLIGAYGARGGADREPRHEQQ